MVSSRRFRLVPIARGFALFFGAFSLANLVPALVGRAAGENIWWIDSSVVPLGFGVWVEALGALLLLAFAAMPGMRAWRRWATVGVAGLLGVVAASNAVGVVGRAARGEIALGVPVPLSLLIAVGFAVVAAGAFLADDASRSRMQRAREIVVTCATALVLVIAFPLLQTVFFGMTDYRAPADAAVVLGARVYDDGALSPALEERVRAGVDVYRSGDARLLVMSGGVGANGLDETLAMKRRAVELGVPEDAILVDNQGVNTDATVANTRAMAAHYGWRRMLVVSHFYHLPRIKLAYRVAGTEVRTVPAAMLYPIGKTPIFVAREVPAFWVYWSRALGRSVLGG